MTEGSNQLRYETKGFDFIAHKKAESARQGDPGALREILREVSVSLRGDSAMKKEFAHFCADALEAFVDTPKVWEAADIAFRELDRANVSIREELTGRGPRLPEKTLRRIGNAFCRAFGLSKPQGADVPRYHFLVCPNEIWKMYYLRLFGASLPRAIRIVRSAYRLELSDRQVKEWFNRAEFLEMPKPGTWGFRVGQHRRRLRLATRVMHRLVRGRSYDDAYSEVAKIAVTELCFLPTATVYLDPKTVEEAYEYVSRCNDLLWKRTERFIRRNAHKSP